MRRKPSWHWWTVCRRDYVLRNYNLETLDSMAEKWGCTVQTIYRDIRELHRWGIWGDTVFKATLRLANDPSKSLEDKRSLYSRYYLWKPLRRGSR